MFRHVLVGVDGEDGGHDAVALARALVDPDGRITLAHVYGGIGLHAPAVERWNRARAERSADLLEAERTRAGTSVEVADIAAPSAGEGLHRLAEQLGADLIVVGTSAREPRLRAVAADDARAALNGAHCAVATAPRGYRHAGKPIARIGVGYDASPESRRALAAAREIGGQRYADIEVLEAAERPSVVTSGPWGDVMEDIAADARKEVEALECVEGTVVEGSAAEALRTLSARVDLLVLGSRGYGPVRRLVFGSTSDDVQRHALCPVLVLPRAA